MGRNPQIPLTELDSRYRELERMSVREVLHNINREDQTVPLSIEKVLPAIENLVNAIVGKMKQGGRLFYMGAGTSGRLGVVDASECPPTFGVPSGLVIGIMAGGDAAIRKAVEFAEDDQEQGWKDLQEQSVTGGDFVVGIAASGTTPYVVGVLSACRAHGVTTGCITCNPGSPAGKEADYPVEVAVGPEFITGSTRMKAGTAQKLILNMLSTAVMIRLGRIAGNKMVDMQLSNTKLVQRGIRMLVEQLGVSPEEAAVMLNQSGSVRKAVEAFMRKDL